jgi:hypothetical protein
MDFCFYYDYRGHSMSACFAHDELYLDDVPQAESNTMAAQCVMPDLLPHHDLPENDKSEFRASPPVQLVAMFGCTGRPGAQTNANPESFARRDGDNDGVDDRDDLCPTVPGEEDNAGCINVQPFPESKLRPESADFTVRCFEDEAKDTDFYFVGEAIEAANAITGSVIYICPSTTPHNVEQIVIRSSMFLFGESVKLTGINGEMFLIQGREVNPPVVWFQGIVFQDTCKTFDECEQRPPQARGISIEGAAHVDVQQSKFLGLTAAITARDFGTLRMVDVDVQNIGTPAIMLESENGMSTFSIYDGMVINNSNGWGARFYRPTCISSGFLLLQGKIEAYIEASSIENNSVSYQRSDVNLPFASVATLCSETTFLQMESVHLQNNRRVAEGLQDYVAFYVAGSFISSGLTLEGEHSVLLADGRKFFLDGETKTTFCTPSEAEACQTEE